MRQKDDCLACSVMHTVIAVVAISAAAVLGVYHIITEGTILAITAAALGTSGAKVLSEGKGKKNG